MRIWPFEFEKSKPRNPRCFNLEGFSKRVELEYEKGNPEFIQQIKAALLDAEVEHMGLHMGEDIWFIDDSEGSGPATGIFEAFGLTTKEVDAGYAKKFVSWTLSFNPQLRSRDGKQN